MDRQWTERPAGRGQRTHTVDYDGSSETVSCCRVVTLPHRFVQGSTDTVALGSKHTVTHVL